jgi:hypothetical protein
MELAVRYRSYIHTSNEYRYVMDDSMHRRGYWID